MAICVDLSPMATYVESPPPYPLWPFVWIFVPTVSWVHFSPLGLLCGV